MTDKFLYFGKTSARSLALTQSEADVQTYTLTTSLINPIPDGVANTNNIFANGALKAELQNLHLDGSGDAHVLGSYYTERGLDVDDGKLFIHPNALSYDGTNLVTVKTVAQDSVYGVTNSSTVGENDVTFTLHAPMKSGDAMVYKSSNFLGMTMVDADTCDIFFKPFSNDGVGAGHDVIRVSYGSGNFTIMAKLIGDILTDNTPQSGMIVVADTWRDIYYQNNPAGITAIDSITQD